MILWLSGIKGIFYCAKHNFAAKNKLKGKENETKNIHNNYGGLYYFSLLRPEAFQNYDTENNPVDRT
jgi:hypothetical protein